jgi:hypothetical protein
MNLSFPSPEFDDAVAAVCHGSVTEVQARALNQLLRNHAGARDEYLLRVELHARLASDPNLFPQATESIADCCTPIAQPDERRPATATAASSTTRRPRLTRVLALAACVALLIGSAWGLWLREQANRTTTISPAVAMLTRVVDAHWGGDTAPPRVGSALEPGWLRLESGLAQVVFYSGVRMVIEGPAELQLLSPTEAACRTGKFLADVPPSARGFRFETGDLTVVDHGTRFGIAAGSGGTEVHVFEGSVELVAGGDTGSHLLGDEQAAVAREQAPLRFMAANPDTFSFLLEFQQHSLASEAYRYEHWQFTSAQLNRDPSLLIRLDFQDFGDTDWTLRNTAQGNRSVPDATVVGCQRAEGRWREKQSLEFQSINDRVLLHVPGEFESLTIAAWVRVGGLDRRLNSLFMCDGFEPGTVHWLIRNDGVLGLTVFGPGTGNFQILASPPVLTLDQFGIWLQLAVVLNGKTRQVIHYVDGVPVSRHTLKQRPPYRLGPAELGNWIAPMGPNAASSQIRNFSGSFDEFVLFSRALSDADIHELYLQGKPNL